VLMDLDKFKGVNDSLGHLEGDLVLARVGRLLEQKCRQSNVVARYGGDEFIILMPETGIEQAQILAERLRLWISTDGMLQEHHITGSFGVGCFPAHGFTIEDIIRVADAGMYISKHAGGDRVSIAEEEEDGESAAMQRQMVSTYIEGFLHREHTGPEQLDELIATLKKMTGSQGDGERHLRDAIEALTRAAESREFHNSGHGELVGRYSEMIARAMGMQDSEVADISFSARVHDVGKIFVPERVLNKYGPRNEDEEYLLRLHPNVGARIVATGPGSEHLQRAIEHHHEGFDGSGYPSKLAGENIPLAARIIAIADAYVNLTTERGLASAKSSEQALSELQKLSGTRYDGMLVRILVRQLKSEKASPNLGS
jgi:two-component system cell cycle response regulator